MSGFNPVDVGVFGKPHGVKGEIYASLDADGLEIEVGDFVFATLDGLDVPFRVLAVRPKGAGVLLSLRSIDSEVKAALLANKTLRMEVDLGDDTDDDDGNVYLEDLIDYTIVSDQITVGSVCDIDDSTADNPLFVVATATGEILIPAAADLINDIDNENKTIIMSLPEGLINLN